MVNFVRSKSWVNGGTNGLDQLGVALMRDSLTAIENAGAEVVNTTLEAQRVELSRALHQVSINHPRATFFIRNIEICLQFISFLLISMIQLAEILPRVRQEFIYDTNQ